MKKYRLKELKTIGHHLKPVVTVASNGLSENVLTEITRALKDHELIKVKISVGDREIKKQIIQQLCEQSSAELIQSIGNVVLILKEAKTSKAKLSNLNH